MPAYAYITLEFLTPFTSYSPTLYEGYIDSTTLQAALTAIEAEFMGNPSPQLASDDIAFSSLLPLAQSDGGDLPLLPPLRIPIVGTKNRGFWTPQAVNKILGVIRRCGSTSVLAYDSDDDTYDLLCAGGSSIRGLLRYSDEGLFHLHGEMVSYRSPSIITDKHRLVIDRITATATPYMFPVVAVKTPYWFIVKLSSSELCETLREALRIARFVGIGALRSAGFGRIALKRFECVGNVRDLTGIVPGLVEFRKAIDALVALGPLLPGNGGCKVLYGRTLKFGALRGYGGRVVNFRRPLVIALAPGSIVLGSGSCKGRVISSTQPAKYSYSFHPLFAPLGGDVEE